MNEIKLTIHPFEMDSLKEAAKKVQEEAGEAFAEYVILQEQQDRSTTRLADEIADTIQASCNLAARYNIDLQSAMERCEQRNRARGRYGNTESCGACGGNDCNCGGGGGAMPDGDDAPKSPEKMSAGELIEALYLASGYRGNGYGYYEDGSCTKTLGVDWCGRYHTCRICRKHLLDLLETAYKQEKEGLRCEESYLADEIVKRDKEIEGLKREIADLIHERDGLRKKQGSKDERCGDCGSIGRNHGGDCGAQCAREHLLPVEQTAQEMNEREKVLERLRGYDVYMTETPSENANRLFACITGNKDAEIACGNDIEAVRDKLIELIGDVNDA
jgi:phosphoribosyl-ATP pyrophosphohydrolase